MQIKKAEAIKVLEKFHFEIRSGKERFAKLYYENTLILTTAVPQGKGDMHVSNQFRQQLKLNEQQLKDAIKCPLKYEGYLEHLKRIGQIDN